METVIYSIPPLKMTENNIGSITGTLFFFKFEHRRLLTELPSSERLTLVYVGKDLFAMLDWFAAEGIVTELHWSGPLGVRSPLCTMFSLQQFPVYIVLEEGQIMRTFDKTYKDIQGILSNIISKVYEQDDSKELHDKIEKFEKLIKKQDKLIETLIAESTERAGEDCASPSSPQLRMKNTDNHGISPAPGLSRLDWSEWKIQELEEVDDEIVFEKDARSNKYFDKLKPQTTPLMPSLPYHPKYASKSPRIGNMKKNKTNSQGLKNCTNMKHNRRSSEVTLRETLQSAAGRIRLK